ncbi:MAG TPA: hypothetical protein VLK27_10730 [Chthoniobacterales bacterium]|nr:hypothetical protein [Chthoniobacterales bacterium]
MKKALILGLVAFGTSIFVAYGDIIPSLSNITGSAPNFSWNYSANVTVDETVNHNDFFTIYDFSAIMPTTTTQPAGWTFSTALIGPTPGKVLPTDNASLWNLTWTYTGTTAIPGASALGIFSAVTGTDQLKTGQFTAEATRSNDPTNTKIDNIGSVNVPVPESTSLLPLIGVCAAALVFAPRLRRQRA